MKSPQVQFMLAEKIISPEDAKKYGDLQVLHSAAGWYLGSMYHDDDGFYSPGSRDTEYYPTEEMAKMWLRLAEACIDAVEWRYHP